MNHAKNALCLNPQIPDGIDHLAEMAEVFPGTPRAVMAFVARLSDGRFAVWAALKGSLAPCSSTRHFGSQDDARAAHAMLVSDLLRYAYPDAAA